MVEIRLFLRFINRRLILLNAFTALIFLQKCDKVLKHSVLIVACLKKKGVFMNKQTGQQYKITALYERLSSDDELQGDSNSIIHQKEILEEFKNAKKHKFWN